MESVDGIVQDTSPICVYYVLKTAGGLPHLGNLMVELGVGMRVNGPHGQKGSQGRGVSTAFVAQHVEQGIFDVAEKSDFTKSDPYGLCVVK